MITDQRTGMRSIRPARETFAAVALTGLTLGTVLRCLDGRPGGVAGVIFTIIILAVLSRYRVSWDANGICYQTPFSCRRKLWTEFSAYSIEPESRDRAGMTSRGTRRRTFDMLQPCRLRLYGRGAALTISLKPYSWQDIRHLTDRINTDVPLHERHAVLVS
jgi:hypothetical protein